MLFEASAAKCFPPNIPFAFKTILCRQAYRNNFDQSWTMMWRCCRFELSSYCVFAPSLIQVVFYLVRKGYGVFGWFLANLSDWMSDWMNIVLFLRFANTFEFFLPWYVEKPQIQSYKFYNQISEYNNLINRKDIARHLTHISNLVDIGHHQLAGGPRLCGANRKL